MIFLSAVWGGISLRTKVLAALGVVFLFAVFMGLRAHDKGVRDKAVAPYVKASTEAVLDAVKGEREAMANSDARHDENDATTATIQKGVDDAKSNGDSPIDGYFDGLRKAQRDNAKDQPAD
jgi:hypothetical protein